MIRLLDVPIATLTAAELQAQLETWIDEGRPRRVYPLQAGVLIDAEKRPRLKQLLIESDLNLAGGEEIRVAARLTRQTIPERLAPEDWIDPLVARLAATHRGLCYLGDLPGRAQAWIDLQKQRYPGLEAFARDGSFEKWGPENDRVVSAIVHARPAVVLVGFGSPYQEEYAHAHANIFRIPLTIAVGRLAETQTGLWPSGPLGPLGPGRWAQLGQLLNRPVRETARHLADPEFIARVLKWHGGR